MTKARTEISRLREMGNTDRTALDALLDSCILGHFGMIDSFGQPLVIPTAVVRDGDGVLAHGSTGSPWMRRLAPGTPTCLTVTAVDGLLVARSAFESSLHYRSAVLFGSCRLVEDKERALDIITERLIPGRIQEIRRHRGQELAATLVIALPIEQWSLKISAGWPDDPADDVAGDSWAGVVATRTAYQPPQPAPDVRPGIQIPASINRLCGRADRDE